MYIYLCIYLFVYTFFPKRAENALSFVTIVTPSLLRLCRFVFRRVRSNSRIEKKQENKNFARLCRSKTERNYLLSIFHSWQGGHSFPSTLFTSFVTSEISTVPSSFVSKRLMISSVVITHVVRVRSAASILIMR